MTFGQLRRTSTAMTDPVVVLVPAGAVVVGFGFICCLRVLGLGVRVVNRAGFEVRTTRGRLYVLCLCEYWQALYDYCCY